LLQWVIVSMEPSSQLREFALSCLLNGFHMFGWFHLTYLCLIKKAWRPRDGRDPNKMLKDSRLTSIVPRKNWRCIFRFENL
jgi:hypothetical protein